VLEEALEKKETQTPKEEDDKKKNSNNKEGVLKPNNGIIFP